MPLSAQNTAEEIETLLSTNAVSYAAAARFLLEASGAMTTNDPEAAFRYATEQNWLPKSAAPMTRHGWTAFPCSSCDLST
jgi:hypothetical protein